ncbi:hypothetical protein BHE74_00031451 [Ensete ventricosum]|nr:hypothetical protein BHE74_00031451 [Ensete ventricosum]
MRRRPQRTNQRILPTSVTAVGGRKRHPHACRRNRVPPPTQGELRTESGDLNSPSPPPHKSVLVSSLLEKGSLRPLSFLFCTSAIFFSGVGVGVGGSSRIGSNPLYQRTPMSKSQAGGRGRCVVRCAPSAERRQGSSIVTDASPRACRARLPQSGLGASHEEKPRGLRCLVWRAGGNTKPSSTHSRLSCYCHQIISYLQRLIPLSRHLRPYLPFLKQYQHVPDGPFSINGASAAAAAAAVFHNYLCNTANGAYASTVRAATVCLSPDVAVPAGCHHSGMMHTGYLARSQLPGEST